MRWRQETRRGPLVLAVALLKLACDDAIARGDEFTAELAHTDLIEAEWRLRQSKNRGRHV